MNIKGNKSKSKQRTKYPRYRERKKEEKVPSKAKTKILLTLNARFSFHCWSINSWSKSSQLVLGFLRPWIFTSCQPQTWIADTRPEVDTGCSTHWLGSAVSEDDGCITLNAVGTKWSVSLNERISYHFVSRSIVLSPKVVTCCAHHSKSHNDVDLCDVLIIHTCTRLITLIFHLE